jgi:hypothetical protein
MKSCVPQFDGTQNLYALALPRDGDFRRVSHPTPGCVQSRVLPKAGFIGKN